jgi:hypothetical protein
VGITYVSLLSGSTVEIVIVLAILTGIFLVIAFTLAFGSYYVRTMIFVCKNPQFFMRLKRPAREINDWEYEDRIETMRQLVSAVPELGDYAFGHGHLTFAETEALWRRRRQLQMHDTRTAEETTELNSINMRLEANEFFVSKLLWFMTKRWMQRHGRWIAATFLIITIVFILPALAFFQASEVLSGKEYFGNGLGFSDYRADLVTITQVSQAAQPSVRALQSKDYFLLGQNSQHVILYSPTIHSTIRIPTTAVIITSAK